MALVYDGTVWTEDGVLPTFVHADEDDADPTRAATRHLADGVHAAPPIPLPRPDEANRAAVLHVLHGFRAERRPVDVRVVVVARHHPFHVDDGIAVIDGIAEVVLPAAAVVMRP